MKPIPFGFRQIDYLIAVAETGSTAAAARRLNVSQPSISVAVAQLEAHFGAAFFLRLPGQGMQPTPFGRERIARLRALRGQAAELFETGGPTMELRLGTYSTLAPQHAPRLMRAFAELHAEQRVVVVEDDIAALVSGLEAARLDLALLYDVGLPPTLELTALADVPPHVLLPPGHRLAESGPIDLNALAEDPIILIDLPHSRGYFLSLFQMAGARPRIAAETRSIEMLRAMVANGLGVGLLATDLPYDMTYDGGRVLRREIAGTLPPSRVVLARARDLAPTEAMQSFLSTATEMFARAAAKGQPRSFGCQGGI
jgi:DNA-binding transcriptional LysR family regulator